MNESVASSTERWLVQALTSWSRAAQAPDRSADDACQKVAALLEWWLSEALQCNPVKHDRHWWSDGVVQLSLAQPDARTIFAEGVTIWSDAEASPEYLAPFEVEFHF